MKDGKLSRREILSGLAAAGSTGALVGSGTGALFSDEETLTDNTIAASNSIAGVVDITVTIEANQDGAEFEVSLPESDLGPDVNETTAGSSTSSGNGESNNNPAHLWVRTETCPDPIQEADELDVEFYLKDCRESTLIEGTLLEVLNSDRLREGYHITCGENDCLQPGETRTLVIESSSNPDETISFDLKFYAQQCRYGNAAENPFDPEQILEEGACVTGKALSYIAFCAEGADTVPDPTITEVNARNDGQPVSVDWEITNGVDIDYVIAKSGLIYTIYDYRNETTTSGTATTDDGDAAFSGTDPAFSECPTGNGGKNSCPCQIAVDEVGGGGTFEGTSKKLEEDKGELEP